jgi:hypothetical protein
VNLGVEVPIVCRGSPGLPPGLLVWSRIHFINRVGATAQFPTQCDVFFEFN